MRLRTFAMCLLLCPLFAASVRAGDPPDPAAGRAREILRLYLDGKSEQFIGQGDEAMQKALTPVQVAAIRAQLQAAVGACVGEASCTVTDAGPNKSVAFAMRHERGFVDLVLVLDARQRLAGFWCKGIRPLSEAPPPPYADPTRFRESDANVRCGEFELPGKLCLPQADRPVPAIALVHGSGPHDADETVFGTRVFRDLAWGLASRGVAVLRYEKRTHRYKDLNPLEVTLESETIDDALSAAKLLRERPDVDPRRIYVLGHSLGGLAAPFIAARDPQLAGLIVLAGAGRSLSEVIPEQIEYIARCDGAFSAADQAELAAVQASVAKLRSGEFADADTLLGAPLRYWADLARRDGPAEAAKLSLPILVLQGGRDYQVNMKCFDRWKAALAGRENVTLHVFDKLNHLMIAGEGPSTPTEYFTPGNVDAEVIDAIANWIR